jgi:hypothetical protein
MDSPLLVTALIVIVALLWVACVLVGVAHLRRAAHHGDSDDPITAAEYSARRTNGFVMLAVSAVVLVFTPVGLWIAT